MALRMEHVLSDGTQAEILYEVNLCHSSEDFSSNLVRRQNHPRSSFRAIFPLSGFLFAFPATLQSRASRCDRHTIAYQAEDRPLGGGWGGWTLSCDTLLISCVLTLKGTQLMAVSTQHTCFYPAWVFSFHTTDWYLKCCTHLIYCKPLHIRRMENGSGRLNHF